MTSTEFSKLPYEEKKKYKSAKRTEVFNEKEYILAIEKHTKQMEEYNKVFEDAYKQKLKEEHILESEAELFSDIMENVLDIVDFSDYCDAKQMQIDFEWNILNSIKSHCERK